MASRTMEPDLERSRVGRIDVSPLVGMWYGIKLDESRFAKLEITERNGTLLISPYGSPESERSDWGQAEMSPYAVDGSMMATGFEAKCRFGAEWVEFVAVQNQGVLLVQSFTSFHDDSGRASEFAKAYYRRAAPELVATAGISTGTTSGVWVNSNPATDRIAEFTVTEGAGGSTIRIRGVSAPIDWGEVELKAYQDRHGESHFYAVYDLEPFEAVIGVISVKNLVVLNQFLRFKDSETANFYCREFFFRNR